MYEQYVSLEVAKLLKEKGFHWNTCCYTLDQKIFCGIAHGTPADHNMSHNYLSLPTLQTAHQWLREEHNILVCVLPCEVGSGVMDYTYCIYRIHADNYYFEPLMQGRISESINYEKTLEAGLEFVLKSII